MKKLFMLLGIGILLSLLLVGCYHESERPSNYILHLEGKGNHWSVSTDIPYSSKSTERYFKVTFVCDSAKHVYDKSDKVFFALGTSVGTCIYHYDKTKGFIQTGDTQDFLKTERVIKISDVEFEVIYDITLVDIQFDESSQLINVQLPNDSIDLQHISS